MRPFETNTSFGSPAPRRGGSQRGRGRGRGGFTNNSVVFNNGRAQGGDIDMAIDGADGESTTEIEIRGWQGATVFDLVGFITRKCQITLQGAKAHGPVVRARIPTGKLEALLKWTGIRFAGDSLTFSVAGDNGAGTAPVGGSGGLSSNAESTITVLRKFLESRYSAENQLLNLTSMASDGYLQANGMFSSLTTSSKMFPAMMKVASMDLKAVESVSLASNQLDDVASVTTLSQTYPHLKNLSLADNNLTQWRNLDPFRGKFREIRELIMTGNPITSLPNYQSEMLRRFPSLKILDGVVVESIDLGCASASFNNSSNSFAVNIQKLPIATLAGFFETDEIQNIVMDFLGKFLHVYDNDRSQLQPLYDNLSQFSLAVNTTAARVSSGVQNWSAYIPLSRNLTRISSPAARVARVAVGERAILELMQRVPATRHDLSDPQKFAIEALTVHGLRAQGDTGIMLVVHGEFEEVPSGGTPNQQSMRRSFDRTILLLPVAETRSMLVVSDMLTIRAWAGAKAWTGR
ncbi:uncharacterized protein V1510DRAFT_235817 [Dipodascopsis tothii]|uniref:uncharacterized protein n=1 Tax=Dipodascopsis tothii TaxID=44089 RepID=UPI0034CFF431